MSAFTLPSASLLSQSVLSGIFVGALYGLMGLGLSLSWGLLRVINLAHFAFAFLAAYLCWQLASMGMDPLLTLAIIVPLFFALGAGLQALVARFAITPFNSLLLTFGLMGIVEAVIQAVWTADFRKLESVYSSAKFKIGFLYVPIPELITLLLSVCLSLAIWAVLRYTDLGRALRAAAEDPAIASAFGVNEKDQAWVKSKLTDQPNGVATQPIKLTGARETIAKKTYIRAPKYPQAAFDKALAECKADATWQTFETATAGHDVMIDAPEWLVEILLQVS